MRQQGYSVEMIEAYKTEKIQRIATVQTAAFLAQQFSSADPQQALTISFEGIDGIEHTITFSVEAVTTVQQSAELAAFQFIYQKLIVEPYQDVTNENYMDRDIPVAYNPHVEQLTDAVRQNNALETYLFDDPAEDPFVVHDLSSVYESEQDQTKEKLVDHYRTYFIEAESDPEEDKQSGQNTQTAMKTNTEDDNTEQKQQEIQTALTEKENRSL